MTAVSKIKMLALSLTGQCNFACRYCYAAGHDKNAMSLQTAIKAVNLAAASKEKFILQFSGGEPLLNFTCLAKITEYVEEHNLPTELQLQTNASLITNSIAEFLVRHKIAIGVSLDGKPTVNDKLRITPEGKGTTDRVLNGLEVLKRHRIAVGITCVVTKDNIACLPELVEFAYFLGNIRKIGFDILRSQGRGVQLEPPSVEMMRKYLYKTYKRADELSLLAGYKIIFSHKQHVKMLDKNMLGEFAHCYAMKGEAAFVDASGRIYACSSLVGNDDFYIGNVSTGIDKVKVKKICSQIENVMKYCWECDSFEHCGGGCFARWYGCSGEKISLPECELKKITIKCMR
ncbi:radical SAM/SPASM domain-containing protein [Pectinatus sottacetonis]|uniref:radical SAM/SPASM domain-containing protein n=1 Tax=Pectinatus sottacetonis TaxID=1002795 RepID=UPI0018C64A63|nr:radical SAM protein [Pectinatus sottacetonis]